MIWLLAVACGPPAGEPPDPPEAIPTATAGGCPVVAGPTGWLPDCDGDGVAPPDDCDDRDDQVSPLVADPCGDGHDADCDGLDTCGWQGRVPVADAARTWANDLAPADPGPADLDADGRADLFLVNDADETLAWLDVPAGELTAESAAATFPGPVRFASGLGTIVADDEIVWIHAGLTGPTAWVTGFGFDAAATPVTGDLDGDGAVDLVVWGDGNSSALAIYRGPFADEHLGPPDASAEFDDNSQDPPVVADFTRDGVDDVLYVIDGACSQFDAWLFSEPQGILDEESAVWHDTTEFGAGRLEVAGDLDGDGIGDLFGHEEYSGESSWFLGPFEDCAACFASADGVVEVPGRAIDLARTGDVDRDGDDDFLVGAPDPFEAEGQAFLVFGPLPVGLLDLTEWTGVWFAAGGIDDGFGVVDAPGDLTGDGVPDLLVGDATDGLRAWILDPTEGGL